MDDVITLNYHISPDDFTRAGEASSDVKGKLKQMGVSPDAVRKVAIAMYEGEINMVIHANGGEITVEITPEKVRNYADAKKADTAKFREYFHFMLDRGNYFGPSQFEAIYVSNAHTLREIDKTLGDADEFFAAHSGN